jgi:hypothetical protein
MGAKERGREKEGEGDLIHSEVENVGEGFLLILIEMAILSTRRGTE